MSKLSFKSKKFEFEFDGELHTIDGLDMKRSEKLTKDFKDPEKDDLQVQREMFISLGMDEETYYKLDHGHISSLMEALRGLKKK